MVFRRKQIVFGLIILGALAFGFVRPQKAAAFSGAGAGSTQYPYRITTCLQLQEMNDEKTASYVLMNDIDCGDGNTGNDTNAWNSGAGFAPIATSDYFTGSFDGRNHTISDLVINRPTENYIGLFGRTNGASIKNVVIEDSVISGQNFVGSLVGIAVTTDISFASAYGVVEGAFTVGGLVGRLETSSTVNGSMLDVVVSSSGAYAGGLAGLVAGSSISNISADVDVDGTGTYSGGIVGYMYADTADVIFERIYVRGSATGGSFNAGVAAGVDTFGYNVTLRSMAIKVETSWALYARRTTADPLTVSGIYYAIDDTPSAPFYAQACSTSSEAGCTPKAESTDLAYFYDYTNAPFSMNGGGWDFMNIWDNPFSNYLALREQPLDTLADLEAPGEVDGLAVTDSLVHSVTLQWAPSATQGSGPPVDYKIEYSLAGEDTWIEYDDNGAANPSLNPVVVEIGGLIPNTEYDFRVSQVNLAGVGPANSAPASGSTSGPVQSITTCTELQDIKYALSANYTLANDIDCADGDTGNDSADWNGGLGFEPIGLGDAYGFTGELNGQGYKITGLFQDRSSLSGQNARVGLFWQTWNAQILNTTIQDSQFTGLGSGGSFVAQAFRTRLFKLASDASITVSGGTDIQDGVGGLAGMLSGGNVSFEQEDSILEQSTYSGQVSGENNVGGLVGYLYYGMLRNTYSEASIIPVDGGQFYGGLVGYQLASYVNDSYSFVTIATTSNLTADSFGGVSGAFRGYSGMTNVFAVNYLGNSYHTPDGSHAGAIVGRNIDNNPENFTNVFYDYSVNLACMDGSGASGCESGDPIVFQSASNEPLLSWDFTTVWQERSGRFPAFRTQAPGVAVYNITNCAELQGMRYDLAGDYTIANNFTCTDSNDPDNYAVDFNNGDGFEPIGDDTHPFTGTLDGQGFEIQSPSISRDSYDNVGLFGVTEDASIGNFTYGNEATVVGFENVGAIIGQMRRGQLYKIEANMGILGSASVGSLVGSAICDAPGQLLISKAVSYANTMLFDSRAGGIVGNIQNLENDCSVTIEHSRNEGYVTNFWDSPDDVENLGGIVGFIQSAGGAITLSYDTSNGGVGNPFSEAYMESVGGIVGGQLVANEGDTVPLITNATHGGVVIVGGQGVYVGGVIGLATGSTNVYQSKNTGDIYGSTGVGGLVGTLLSFGSTQDIRESYATGTVSGNNYPETGFGGLVGLSDDATIIDSFSNQVVNAGVGDDVGGIGGNFGGDIVSSYAAGEVHGDERVGGLVGLYESSGTDEDYGLYGISAVKYYR